MAHPKRRQGKTRTAKRRTHDKAVAPTMAISANEHTAFPKTSRTIINNSNHIWPSSMKLLQTIYPDTVFFPFSCLHYTKGNRPITAAEILFQTLPGSFK